MPPSDEALRALREAVQLSPDNVPLRQHLADTLMSSGRPAEAEKEYRHALALAGDNARLKLGLGESFYQQAKYSEARVVVEDLLRDPKAPARALLLHARLLLEAGETRQAVVQYQHAVERDDKLSDAALARELGLEDDEEDDRVVGRRERARWEESDDDQARDGVESPAVTFADVGGMDALKDEIRIKIIHPLERPELFAAYGKPIGGGILMYGPPGCGKTHLARATAGEVRAAFVSVGINEVLTMWIGESERNLHQVFENARGHKPCVLFFDEVDALGASRADSHSGNYRRLINQFLAELDGIGASNEGVLVLAATNAPWHLDSALRRPGRFDRILFVPPPDLAARTAIVQLLCQGKPTDAIDFEAVGKKTEGFSGADLKAVMDLAVEAKLREALRDGIPRPITTRDLLTAAAGVKPSTREWFATARNYALYSNQGGIYDDILKYLKM
jgi:SpoVK/Ycf46/Vps4 family AAA+-type ATPase